jgi:hypothetical protein
MGLTLIDEPLNLIAHRSCTIGPCPKFEHDQRDSDRGMELPLESFRYPKVKALLNPRKGVFELFMLLADELEVVVSPIPGKHSDRDVVTRP